MITPAAPIAPFQPSAAARPALRPHVLRPEAGRTVAALSIAALTTRIRAREAELAEALGREADLMERERIPAGQGGPG